MESSPVDFGPGCAGLAMTTIFLAIVDGQGSRLSERLPLSRHLYVLALFSGSFFAGICYVCLSGRK